MKRYWGGQKVEAGTYVNLDQLAFASVHGEEALPGSDEDEYRRVPAVALLVAGPLLGGLYVIFLPVIGFAMLAWTAGTKAVEIAGRGVAASTRVLSPAWEPSRAFLSRGKRRKKTRAAKDAWAEETAKELRQTEKK